MPWSGHFRVALEAGEQTGDAARSVAHTEGGGDPGADVARRAERPPAHLLGKLRLLVSAEAGPLPPAAGAMSGHAGDAPSYRNQSSQRATVRVPTPSTRRPRPPGAPGAAATAPAVAAAAARSARRGRPPSRRLRVSLRSRNHEGDACHRSASRLHSPEGCHILAGRVSDSRLSFGLPRSGKHDPSPYSSLRQPIGFGLGLPIRAKQRSRPPLPSAVGCLLPSASSPTR